MLNSEHLWHALLAIEAHHLLQEVYGEYVLSQKTSETQFNWFKSGDFELSNKECGKSVKKFKYLQLQALLDEDNMQMQNELAKASNLSQSTFAEHL